MEASLFVIVTDIPSATCTASCGSDALIELSFTGTNSCIRIRIKAP